MACYLITVMTGSFVNSLFFVFRNDVIDNKITEIQFRLLIKSCWFHDKILFNALILKGNLFQNWNFEWSNGMCSLKVIEHQPRRYPRLTEFISDALKRSYASFKQALLLPEAHINRCTQLGLIECHSIAIGSNNLLTIHSTSRCLTNRLYNCICSFKVTWVRLW